MIDFRKSRNYLLSQLPEGVAQAMLRTSEVIHYDYRETLYVGDTEIEYVDFPETGVISLLQKSERSEFVEIVNIGNEGMIGSALVANILSIPQTAVCQVQGSGTRFKKQLFLKYLDAFPQFKQICQRYTIALFERTAKSIVCSKVHSHQERCASWMLSCQDRCGSSEFRTTQDALASLLGCSRTAVNLSAGFFQDAGLIRYSRGKVTILHRPGLKHLCCDCFDYALDTDIASDRSKSLDAVTSFAPNY